MSNFVTSFKNVIPELKYTLLSYDVLKYEKDWGSVAHAHPYAEILFIKSGKGTFVNGGRHCRVSTGTVVVTNPYVSHAETSTESAPVEYAVISLGDIGFSLSDGAGTAESFIFDMKDRWADICAYLNRIETEINQKEPYWESAVRGAADELLVLVLRAAKLNHAAPNGSGVNERPQQAAELLRQYIERHYAEKLTLEELAEKFFFNKYYLIRCFKRAVGCTPMQYLIHVRLCRAKDLLRDTDYNISDIALQTGFASAAHFAVAFREKFGTSPGKYRKRGGTDKSVS